jgi:hypothetical protein
VGFPRFSGWYYVARAKEGKAGCAEIRTVTAARTAPVGEAFDPADAGGDFVQSGVDGACPQPKRRSATRELPHFFFGSAVGAPGESTAVTSFPLLPS